MRRSFVDQSKSSFLLPWDMWTLQLYIMHSVNWVDQAREHHTSRRNSRGQFICALCWTEGLIPWNIDKNQINSEDYSAFKSTCITLIDWVRTAPARFANRIQNLFIVSLHQNSAVSFCVQSSPRNLNWFISKPAQFQQNPAFWNPHNQNRNPRTLPIQIQRGIVYFAPVLGQFFNKTIKKCPRAILLFFYLRHLPFIKLTFALSASGVVRWSLKPPWNFVSSCSISTTRDRK